MEITYLGHSSFKIKTKLATIVTDPSDSKVEGDIVTTSTPIKVEGVRKVVSGPGEYEIMDVSIIGYPTTKSTIYVFEVDGLRLAHLGDLGQTLSEEMVNELGDIDVLMIPVGGESTMGPKAAVELVSKIEPFFVIPMNYKEDDLNAFLKESGIASENFSKFTLKKEDIVEDQTTKIIVLDTK